MKKDDAGGIGTDCLFCFISDKRRGLAPTCSSASISPSAIHTKLIIWQSLQLSAEKIFTTYWVASQRRSYIYLPNVINLMHKLGHIHFWKIAAKSSKLIICSRLNQIRFCFNLSGSKVRPCDLWLTLIKHYRRDSFTTEIHGIMSRIC